MSTSIAPEIPTSLLHRVRDGLFYVGLAILLVVTWAAVLMAAWVLLLGRSWWLTHVAP